MIDKSKYSYECQEHMNYLMEKYPRNFWGDSSIFFTDNLCLNIGANFFLMPSMFEPGGLVQHESLIAGTPVICFSTGGLKDSIYEF